MIEVNPFTSFNIAHLQQALEAGSLREAFFGPTGKVRMITRPPRGYSDVHGFVLHRLLSGPQPEIIRYQRSGIPLVGTDEWFDYAVKRSCAPADLPLDQVAISADRFGALPVYDQDIFS